MAKKTVTRVYGAILIASFVAFVLTAPSPAAAQPHEKGAMTHEVATLMQSLKKAKTQHQVNGSTADLQKVFVLEQSLANRGFGVARPATPAAQAARVIARRNANAAN